MPNPTWPALPFPQRPMKGATVQPKSNVLRSETDSGQPKTRPLSSVVQKTIPCQISLTAAESAQFVSFWETSCASGALPFDWVHPITGVAGTFRFVNFVGPTYLGEDLHKFDFTVEIM